MAVGIGDGLGVLVGGTRVGVAVGDAVGVGVDVLVGGIGVGSDVAVGGIGVAVGIGVSVDVGIGVNVGEGTGGNGWGYMSRYQRSSCRGFYCGSGRWRSGCRRLGREC